MDETRPKAVRKMTSLKMKETSIHENAKASVDDAARCGNLEYEQMPSRQRSLISRSFSGSIAKIRRKSWLPSDRSPSPTLHGDLLEKQRSDEVDREAVSSWPNTNIDSTFTEDFATQSDNGLQNGFIRRNSMSRRRSWRPLSTILGKNSDFHVPVVPQIPRSFTDETLASVSSRKTVSSTPTIPSRTSNERLQSPAVKYGRKKDELWSTFRDLDSEFQKFQAKPSNAKTAVIRSTILPFLRNYANHHSNINIRPEHLDRRVVILNKWWTGVIEMLNGRHGESVSGNERPAVLEAATGLMTRPEWTTSPVRTGKATKPLPKSRSATSLTSNMSDFLVDSVFHNVKTMLSQNLLAQMAYVVDKMSTRNVAASVVNFCGKATAYAFFYCNGIAEVLVRLWELPSKSLRQIGVHSGWDSLPQDANLRDKVVANFPYSLRPLGGLAGPIIRHLRTRPHLPAAASRIPWTGPWVSRWSGGDTDLFYIFVKFYVDIACRLLPDDVSQEARTAAPGWLLIHAQLLRILERTLRRSEMVSLADPAQSPLPVTFDSILGEAEATAPTLPINFVGLHRSMAENRLIMLFRDSLSSANVMDKKTQRIFAESINAILKTAASTISIFDHDTCFSLCDFLEEAIPILNRYQADGGSFSSNVDWDFWFEVYKRFLESQNSLTEVRLIAFIFSMWGALTSDARRKRDLTCGWLLDRKIFHRQFNHWCPMVRAFYMRLLIWRIGRLDGKKNDDNRYKLCPRTEILDVLRDRLEETWSHYLFLQRAAEEQGLPRVSTTPCSPAPSRCLVISRDDIQPAQSGMFLSFDGILSSTTTAKANPYEKHSSPDFLFDHERSKPQKQSSLFLRDSWMSIKSMLLSGATGGRSDSEASSTQPEASATTTDAKSDILRPRTQEGFSSDLASAAQPTLQKAYRPLSFKFSLEWMEKEGRWVGREKRMSPPRTPPFSLLPQSNDPVLDTSRFARKIQGLTRGPGTYTGRALAEWSLSIAECQDFIDRRRAEGVPSYDLVETPTLTVDPFRKV
ncbi:uncharacterized protein KY384_000646 [Bacidia gigantensis]|uniref:uncharacterized protein n=1 Tax=Bacidia gigantensis TaxID=2732470 RepID=UPI001D053740|nr:uncharacterized protein KY384_000646 [Bacidia gigantensis]KAG8525886.1 hypothetical protein KY384_000646 [Bacidia gigantensis]